MEATTTWGVRHEQARQRLLRGSSRVSGPMAARNDWSEWPKGHKTTGIEPHAGPSAQPAAITPPRILIVGADPATLGLFQEWLAAGGYDVVDGDSTDRADRDRFALAIIDAPFPRQARSICCNG